MGVKIIQGDCLDLMRDMEPASFDLVFCSPPYEAARTYSIDFDLKGQAWVDWAVPRFMQCLRVCKGLVAWVVEGQTRQFRWSATPALMMADLHRQGVHLRKPPIYERDGIPGSGGPDWLKNRYEFIVCASQSKLPWSDNTAMGHAPIFGPGGQPSHRRADGSRVGDPNRDAFGFGGRRVRTRAGHGAFHMNQDEVEAAGRPAKAQTRRKPNGNRARDGDYHPPALANPGNIIDCGPGGGGQIGSPLAHENEAPFPEQLAEFFILSFCPPQGIVLDPFSGSGTTAAMAVKHNRRAIAIDIRKSQVELTRKRVATVAPLFAEADK